jgi:hypothetical protein
VRARLVAPLVLLAALAALAWGGATTPAAGGASRPVEPSTVFSATAGGAGEHGWMPSDSQPAISERIAVRRLDRSGARRHGCDHGRRDRSGAVRLGSY